MHWADEATLDVLRLLARRVETVPALVIASYRDDELDPAHPLRIVLGELTTTQNVGRMKLVLLSPGAVAQLAEPYGVDADELYRKTAGNPFFVIEALAAGAEGIPETVREAVLARAARLSPAARTVLEAVAVVPPQAELWLLEALAGEAVNGLDECLTSGMLTSESAGVAFRHELARLAVDESVGTAPKGRPASQGISDARRATGRRARSGPARAPRRGGRRRRRGASLRTRGSCRSGVSRRAPRGGGAVRTGAAIR